MEQWKQGETVTLEVVFKTAAGVETDPETHTVSVENKDGTKVLSAQDMSKSATGVWFYDYPIPDTAPPGIYHGEALLIKDGNKSTPECWFAVVDRIS